MPANNPARSNVVALHLQKTTPGADIVGRKSFSFDIIQIDTGSNMMTIDACMPVSV